MTTIWFNSNQRVDIDVVDSSGTHTWTVTTNASDPVGWVVDAAMHANADRIEELEDHYDLRPIHRALFDPIDRDAAPKRTAMQQATGQDSLPKSLFYFLAHHPVSEIRQWAGGHPELPRELDIYLLKDTCSSVVASVHMGRMTRRHKGLPVAAPLEKLARESKISAASND